jgi:hypothetical protein
VHTKREGWRYVVKALTPSIKTRISIDVLGVPNKSTLENLAKLPSRVSKILFFLKILTNN